MIFSPSQAYGNCLRSTLACFGLKKAIVPSAAVYPQRETKKRDKVEIALKILGALAQQQLGRVLLKCIIKCKAIGSATSLREIAIEA
ncbi:MAG: hypothetical protein QNJ53_12430 [Pleurocapsa sp. MO_192.B19]|nr:hypothetical protein [Pleurocapsa sp. MO_192.B19]